MEKLRIDKWLWAARFFKTRAVAAKAVNAGKVKLEGAKVKPARQVSVGENLEITREAEVFQVTITRLLDKRGPAKVAITMYQESPQSIAKRAHVADVNRVTRAAEPTYGKRPQKRDRRKIGELIGKREWRDQ